jgi:hypothetical protein
MPLVGLGQLCAISRAVSSSEPAAARASGLVGVAACPAVGRRQVPAAGGKAARVAAAYGIELGLPEPDGLVPLVLFFVDAGQSVAKKRRPKCRPRRSASGSLRALRQHSEPAATLEEAQMVVNLAVAIVH